MKLHLITAVFLFGLSTLAFADGEVKNSDWIAEPEEPTMPAEPKAPHIKISAAEYDKRLPPTLPGEQLDTKGRKMKVWSSSGPVPVADAPEPWKDKNEDITLGSGENGSIGVIVDKRHGKRDR